MHTNKVHCNNSVQLKLDCQLDAIVTDPPYGINYDEWDKYDNCVSFDKDTWKNISEKKMVKKGNKKIARRFS